MTEAAFSFDKEPVGACPLCGGQQSAAHIELDEPSGGRARYVRCADCETIYMDPAPTDASLAAFYAGAYGDPARRAADGCAHADMGVEFVQGLRACEEILDRIAAYRQPPGRLLDVGCGMGGVMLEAATRGWSVLGIEPSATLAAFCRGNFGLPVLEADFMAADIPGPPFDVILMMEFLEHVRRPGTALQRANALAADNAAIYITAPNADSAAARALAANWVGWKPPLHLQFYNLYSIQTLLIRNGWKPLHTASGGAYPGQVLAIARKV
jgi:spore maturation protein CgeB